MQKDCVNMQEYADIEKEATTPVEYAGFWVRLSAYVIDSLIVFAALLIVRLIFMGVEALIEGTVLGGNVLFHYTLKDIVLYGAQVLYFILCTYYTGTTLGKRALNLRVINADGEEKLTFLNVLYRETVGRFLSGVVLSIGYLMIGIDKEKRAFHDVLCDTRVIYGKRVKIYPQYRETIPVQQVPPVQPVSMEQKVPPVSPQAQPTPEVPRMPEGGYEFIKPENTVTESTEERDS